MRRTYGVLSSVALNQRERLCGLDPRTTSFVLFVTAAQRLPTRHYTKATSSTSTQTTTTTWDCCPFFPRVEGKAREEDERTNGEKCLVGGGETSAVVVVDRPLYPDRPNYAHYLTIFSNLWHNAQLRVCADGGANRVHALSKESYVPDFIIGDLDSARDDVLDYYTNTKGTQLLRVAEQETTDLDKCIRTIWELENKRSVHVPCLLLFPLLCFIFYSSSISFRSCQFLLYPSFVFLSPPSFFNLRRTAKSFCKSINTYTYSVDLEVTSRKSYPTSMCCTSTLPVN
ncbi:thiamine pyrophosphokinase [Balamuthia mandrillaris]